MRKRAALAGLLIATVAFGASPSQAEVEDGCFAGDGSSATPHLTDPQNDWKGPVLGNGEASMGDVYREAIDLRTAWLTADEGGGWSAHWKTQEFTGSEAGVVMYWLFDWAGGDPAVKLRRFVSAQIQFYGSEGGIFRYGYLDSTTPGLGTFTNEGYTTGGFADGVVSLKIPMDKFGATPADAPTFGSILSNVLVETRVVTGSPGHGHREITPTGSNASGLVWQADDSINGEGCFEIGL